MLTQSKTRSHSISGLRWTSGTPALLGSLVPSPHPQWLSLFNCSPQSGCFPSAWTPDSEELTTSRQPVLFSVLLSSQLEGFLFCDLPVCCPGIPPQQPGLQPVATCGSIFHGSTIMKTANLKTAITAPSLTQCPGSPPFLQ